ALPILALLSLGAGCGDGPPFDELPLRDALRAEPEAVAALPLASRQTLAARLEAARTGEVGTDRVEAVTQPAALVTALDEARVQRSADALVVGAVTDGVARPVSSASPDDAPLPALEGVTATGTAALEAGALAGSAGTTLRGLLAASRAARLERVVGWPVGAVAIGDTVYVDAAWLVALAPAPSAADAGDSGAVVVAGGRTDPTAATTAATTSSVSSVRSPLDGGASVAASYFGVDAGTYVPPPTPPPPPPPPPSSSAGFWDACAAGCSAGDSCDTGSEDDSCSSTDDGSSDSCSGGTDDGSGDACSTPPDDGSSCRVAPGRERPRAATVVWVLAPLGFLVGRRR